MFIPRDLAEYGKIVIYTLLFGANFQLAGSRGYFDPAMQENPLLHMRSLSVEEQFYMIWPVIVLFSFKFFRGKLRTLTFILFAASLVAAEILIHIWPKSAFFHLPTRGWELLAGALLALNCLPRIRNQKLAEALSLLGLALTIIPIFVFTEKNSGSRNTRTCTGN